MFFWIREFVGWGLIALAMIMVRFVFIFVSNRQVVEAGVIGLILMAVLRAGILLIRISTAARVAMKTTPGIFDVK
jgi:hypothetical protein